MVTRRNPTDEEFDNLTSNFEEKYRKVLSELDALYEGELNEEDGPAMAALCLIAQAALLKDLSASDLAARALKKDIDFAESDAYFSLKNSSVDGKKVTESSLAQLVQRDDKVRSCTYKQIQAEKEFKHFSKIHELLTQAHITFRSIKKNL